jgi:hypothetical protein
MTQTDTAPAADVQETVLATCAPGRSRAVLIEGAPGLGKTTLLGRVAQQAGAAGAVVLTAAGSERLGPLGMVRQLVAGDPVLARSSLLDGDPRRPADTAAAFCAALRALARRVPVVLCVDDVQYADPQSLLCLRHVVRYAHPAPVVVAVTTATHSSRWQELFTPDALRCPHVNRVRLALLGPGETERAVAAGTGSARAAHSAHAHAQAHAHAAARLHRLSGGNPLLLHALLAENALTRQPAPNGPFAQAVADCLRRSGPAALATAHVLAVLGERPVDPTVLAELVDGGAPQALDGLSALRACGLLDGLARRDPAVRAAALADCHPAARARLRLRAAHALHAAGAPATAVAAPLLALRADGARPPAHSADRYLLARTARELAQAGRVLRRQGRTARADTMMRAARQLSLQAGEIALHDEMRPVPAVGRSAAVPRKDGRGSTAAAASVA